MFRPLLLVLSNIFLFKSILSRLTFLIPWNLNEKQLGGLRHSARANLAKNRALRDFHPSPLGFAQFLSQSSRLRHDFLLLL